jgi:hypothetical protein
VILKRICQLSLTRITHQVSRAFDLNMVFGQKKGVRVWAENLRFIMDHKN